MLWVVLPGIAIPLFIGLLFLFPQQLISGAWVRNLPSFHASINALTACFLMWAFWAIKRRNVRLHRRLIYVCLVLGSLFLISYVLYHGSVPPTRYGDLDGDGLLSQGELQQAGSTRILYFIFLSTHIFLSIVGVYLVLIALHHARQMAFAKHRRWVRIAFPVWWYMSVSGVIVYLLIRPYYLS